MTEALANKQEWIENDIDQGINQYVTFYIGSEVFGFSMASVLEIIRLPKTVQVPLTPTALVGLANLRGNILPILDLRSILKLDTSNYDDSSRVIVSDAGSPIGLIVDSVSQVISVEDDQVDNNSQIQSSLNADLFNGVINSNDNMPMIQLLDINKLISLEFSKVISSAVNELAVKNIDTESLEDTEEEATQLVSFSVQSQEYAFNLLEVEEIVRMPETVTNVPRSDDNYLGLMNLRGRLLPLVSLRRLFSLDEIEPDENHRIVVISLQSPTGFKNSIGLLVDDVIEVLRVENSHQEVMPRLLADKDESINIESVCRLDDGQRLVSILSAYTLFSHPTIQAAIDARNTEEESQVIEEEIIEGVEDEENEQLVVFYLGEQEYGVSIDDVQEITRVPEKMDKVPKTADFIEGMVNLRGIILPVLDMRTRFELPKIERGERQRILVLSLEGTHTGFIVDSVAEVLRLTEKQIEVAPNLSEDQSRIMGRVVNLKEAKRMIQVITVKELLSDQEISLISDVEG